jgi:hypothetical protein
MLDLNPSGKCIGPTAKGCPYHADALPPRTEGKITTVRYHCARCYPAYCARYDVAR